MGNFTLRFYIEEGYKVKVFAGRRFDFSGL